MPLGRGGRRGRFAGRKSLVERTLRAERLQQEMGLGLDVGHELVGGRWQVEFGEGCRVVGDGGESVH